MLLDGGVDSLLKFSSGDVSNGTRGFVLIACRGSEEELVPDGLGVLLPFSSEGGLGLEEVGDGGEGLGSDAEDANVVRSCTVTVLRAAAEAIPASSQGGPIGGGGQAELDGELVPCLEETKADGVDPTVDAPDVALGDAHKLGRHVFWLDKDLIYVRNQGK